MREARKLRRVRLDNDSDLVARQERITEKLRAEVRQNVGADVTAAPAWFIRTLAPSVNCHRFILYFTSKILVS